jgi:dTDP-glucose 4,6-dehydratase
LSLSILVTGGSGFIGSALIRYLLAHTTHRVINIDNLTYASHLSALAECAASERYKFVKSDINNIDTIRQVLCREQPSWIFHLAAETHVDRSIAAPEIFLQSNVAGTFQLLQACLSYWQTLAPAHQSQFRFLQVSTDEVYGDIPPDAEPSTENTAYKPSSPYAASKASADHFVRAWHRTYNFPALITCCSNNYGPYQHPEKLIPRFIHAAWHGQALPIFGDGLQSRDWLHVEDHILALMHVMKYGQLGETYNIATGIETSNMELISQLCTLLDAHHIAKKNQRQSVTELIARVADRAGHDRRYALNCQKINQLGWTPKTSLVEGLKQTVAWYLADLET